MKKYTEETPSNIEDLKRKASAKTSYKTRLEAVEELGKYKCRQSIDILWRRMNSDKVYLVQETAFRKLQAFGEDVKLPRKKKGNLVKDISKKLTRVRDSLPEGFSKQDFTEKFKTMFPTEYDIYSYEKSGSFEKWIGNMLSSLPKRK